MKYTRKKINDQTFLFQLQEGNKSLSFDRVLELWQSSVDFRLFYNQLLAEQPFDAFFWEHPPIAKDNIGQEYEFVLIDSPHLAKVSAQPQAFADYFSDEEQAVTFANLRGDAQLVVPTATRQLDYTHLAKFCRTAPTNQIHAFYQLTSHVVRQHLSERPRWLSTSGLGVYWLHLRLDQRPKYYHHGAYKKIGNA